MKKYFLFCTLSVSLILANAQQPNEGKKTVKEVIEKLPEMLLAQPDAGPDTNANKLINDNLSIEIPPLWREKGLHTLVEFKLSKIDKEPLSATLPASKKAQDLVISMSTVKKSVEEKKQQILSAIKSHLTAYYKESDYTLSTNEIAEKAASMTSGPQQLVTTDGKIGEVYFFNDIQAAQSAFIILMIVPDSKPGFNHVVQFAFSRYTYETSLPEDALELKTFEYQDDEKEYTDFTLGILRTFKAR